MNRKASNRSGPRRANPAGPGPALSLALSHHREGRLEAADRAYAAIKRRDPDYAEALRLRGIIAHQGGKPAAAARWLGRALEQQPSNPVYHHTLAEILRASGQLDAAVASYRRAYTLAPERHATGIELADTQAKAGDPQAALASYRAVAELSPGHAEANERIATVLHETGDPSAARAQLAHWHAQVGDDRALLHRIAATHAAIGDFDRAAELYRELQAAQAGDAAACAGLGSVLQSQGDFDAARHWLERALALKPDIGWVYAALLSDRGYVMDADRQATMHELIAQPGTSTRSRINLHFALGQLHDRRGEYETAFGHFQAGNRLHARAVPFDRSIFDDRIDRIIAQFTPAFFARQLERADVHATQKPVFVVGMPRSGTSLVEQIIASHPQAFGAGELDDIRRLIRELPRIAGGGSRFPECVDRLQNEQLQQLAERYLAALDARAPEASRVTDKMPFNMLWLGLIALLFPHARVIYCRREAMDNCLSCYFQIFSQGLRFSYDLGHVGHVYRQHERLMAHWAQTLPLSMITVDYESLVDDQEREIRRLIDFVGLDWDERCLDFHRTERAVRTASVWQVRQPVYRSSVERWRAYEPWLGELRDALDS